MQATGNLTFSPATGNAAKSCKLGALEDERMDILTTDIPINASHHLKIRTHSAPIVIHMVELKIYQRIETLSKQLLGGRSPTE